VRSTAAIFARARDPGSLPVRPAGSPAGSRSINATGCSSPVGRPGRRSSTTRTRGRTFAVYQLATPPFTWINDVVITRTGAWFTDSNRLVLYHVPIAQDGALGAAETVPLTGDFVAEPGMPTLARANGIDATPDGKTLLFVTTNSGKLFAADPATGVTDQIEVAGGPLTTPDGILLDGKTLYVAGNGQRTIVQLAPDLSSGTVVAKLTDSNFDTPTTIAEDGNRLYVADAGAAIA
jgi:sugar lactone lactonase YvrE